MKTKIIFSILICLSVSDCIFSQWIQTDGPYGSANVKAIFENNTAIFIGTGCGLHVADSVAARWRYVADIDMDVFSQKGDSLFFGGLYSGVQFINLSDANAGPVLKGLNSASVKALKTTDTCLFAGVETEGFYKSTGFSDNWTAYNDGLPVDTMYIPPKFGGGEYYVRYINAIEIMHDRILCGTNKGVYRSGTDNIAWIASNDGMPEEQVHLLTGFHDTVFACINNIAYYSINNGDSWEVFYAAPSKISSICEFNGIIYVTTLLNGIFHSADKGMQWNSLNHDLTDLNVTALSAVDTTLICGTASKGIYYYNGSAWVNCMQGIICSSIRSMTIADNVIIANDDKAIYIQEDNYWRDIGPAVKNDLFVNLDAMGDTIFVCNYYIQSDWPYIYQFIYYSADTGNTWTVIAPLPYTSPGGNSWHQIYIHDHRIYAYSSEKMFFTDDLGLHWTDVSIPDEYCNNFNSFLVYNGTPVAAACGIAQLLLLDPENHWNLSNTGLPTDREINNLAKTKNTIYAYVSVHGMYMSRDSGQTWMKANDGLDTEWGIRSFAYLDKNIFVTTETGIYYSDNYGRNWNQLNDGLINTNTSAIEIFHDTVYAGTYGNGIWKHDIKSIPLSIPETACRNRIMFYPNPAADFITFDTGDKIFNHIRIIDLTGRQILNVPWHAGEPINISAIPEGAYIIQNIGKNEIYTDKLIIHR
jgi:hypothetical protein